MKKEWAKPVILKISVSKMTLSGSGMNAENSGQDDQTTRHP